MKKPIIVVSILLVVSLVGVGTYSKYIRGIFPILLSPSVPIEDQIGDSPGPGGNNTDFPLKLPPNFSVSIFAKNLPGVRVMAFDQFGNMWVSQTSEGMVSLLEVEDGKVARQNPVLKNLARPHGLVFDPQFPSILYIAEEDKIFRLPTYSDGGSETVVALPEGRRHFTRTIKFGPDDRLYVSIGSSCDVCIEVNDRFAKIFSMKRDGSDMKEFARGLRNTVFFDWSYVDGRMWGTEMGRDWLGDDAPPDEINILEEGKNYGWPICYGKNNHDTSFDKNTYIRNPCMAPFETPSYIDIPAHSAPLGLAFIPEEGWPEEYWYDLLIAYHGSWNRSDPTGYTVVRAKLDAQGNFSGFEDFITGWLQGSEALGRPVDIIARPGGVLYISDDKAGVIYKVAYKNDEIIQPPLSREEWPCIKTGCSGQICSDDDIITTCEFREEYACYKTAVCERGQDGKCGWRDTKELSMCLKSAKGEARIP